MLWGEIKVDFDDLKHIVHPNRRFDELCDTIMTCLRDLHVLSSGFQTSSSGLERRLVLKYQRWYPATEFAMSHDGFCRSMGRFDSGSWEGPYTPRI